MVLRELGKYDHDLMELKIEGAIIWALSGDDY